MGSVFISYAREDVRLAEAAAAALERTGLTVWWDRRLAGGSEYSREIEQALSNSDVVVVIWSSSSVNSPWVRDEAAKGRDAGKLVPATLDGTEPPLGFGQYHSIELSSRRIGRSADGLEKLVEATKQRILQATGAAEATAKVGRRRTTGRPKISWAALSFGAAALAGIVGALAYFLIGGLGSQPDKLTGGTVAIAGFEPLADDPQTRRVAQQAEAAVERTFATNFIETLGRSASESVRADADFTLRGSVDRVQNELAIQASVIDPGSGRTLWSTEVARPLTQSRELTEELAIFLADVIRCSTYTKRKMPKYDSEEVLSRIFRSCEAERSGGRQFAQLAAVSQALVDVAPESAQAWAYLANTTAFLYPDRRQQAQAAAKKALELDPQNGAVRWGLAIMPDPKITLAERERLLREGLMLDPEFLWHRNHLGHVMRQVGRTRDALKWYQEFVGHYPLDHQVRILAAYLQAQTESVPEARKEFERIVELRPWNKNARIYAIRAEILFGEPERARRWVRGGNFSRRDSECVEFLIGALSSGTNLSAERIERACLGDTEIFQPTQLFALFGHQDRVFELLEKMQAPQGTPTHGPAFVYEPAFKSVRADPRFIPWLVRWGIPQYWLETDNWPDFCRQNDPPYDCRQAAMKAVSAAR